MACKDLREKDKVLCGKEETVHNINIGNMILNAFKSKPDFIGQIDAETEEQITFRQMRENSVKCALWLQKSYCKNIVISICTRHQMLAYIPFLASLYIGAIINPWDEKYFEDKLRVMYFLVEYEPEVIFIDRENYKLLNSAIKVLATSDDAITPPKIITFGKVEDKVEVDSLESILNDDFDKDKIDKFFCEETKPIDIMAVMFSPNATSYPGKAHIRYFAFTYPANLEIPVMSPNDIGLWYGSLNWTHSMTLTIRSIVSYVTVIKCSKFNDEDMYETIEKYKVSWVFLDSNMCNQLFQTDVRMYNVSSLKQLVFGDSAINSDIYKALIEYFKNASIVKVYTLSDTCIIATYQRNNEHVESNGYVAKNIQLIILDLETKDDVGPNTLGEIWYKFICKWCNAKTCKSPYCSNYRAKKDTDTMTYAAITSTWHCTGDYGYYEKNGEVYVIDKIKHLIKYNKFYISPARIENVLQRHPAVSEVVVQSVPNHTNGQHPIAYVKKKCEAKVTEKELIEFVAENLPDIYKLRGGLYFRTTMPYLPNGKIDRMLIHNWPSNLTLPLA